MKLEILHLYSDLLNLYGETGNVRLLEKRLAQCGFETALIRHRLGEDFEPPEGGFLYCGSGTERKLLTALADIYPRRGAISAFAQAGGCGLFSGNAAQLCGSSVTDMDGVCHPALGLFDFESVQTADSRATGDVVCGCALTDGPCVGFINTASGTRYGEGDPLFTVTRQFGSLPPLARDGGFLQNFLCTQLVGPVLVKNPALMDFFVRQLCQAHGADYVPDPSDEARLAHDTALRELLGPQKY